MEVGLLKMAPRYSSQTLFLLSCASGASERWAGVTLARTKRSNWLVQTIETSSSFGLDIGKRREALGEAKTHLYPRFDTSVLAAPVAGAARFSQSGRSNSVLSPETGPIPGSNTDLHTPAPSNRDCPRSLQPSRLRNSFASSSRSRTKRLKVDAAQLSFDQREQKAN